MVVTADAVVIGAGVMGSSIALELARTGLRVAVVDKGPGPGQGSTSASSAIMRFNYSTYAGVATAWESLHCWQGWRDHLEAATGSDLASYTRTGVVMLDVPVAPRDRAISLFRSVGVPYEEWDSETLQQRVPAIDPGRFWPPKPIADEAFWAETDDHARRRVHAGRRLHRRPLARNGQPCRRGRPQGSPVPLQTRRDEGPPDRRTRHRRGHRRWRDARGACRRECRRSLVEPPERAGRGGR